MKIELLPTSSNSDVKLKFEGLLLNCKSFKSCVPFWTIDYDYFKFNALSDALKRNDSFICVDLEKPTNIDNIARFNNNGVSEIYLHKFRISPLNLNSDNINLLHSKIYVFEFDDDLVEIWVGSHNLTNYALSGINLETSFSIKCSKKDSFYIEIVEYLRDVKDNYCFQFDSKLKEIYEKLQSRSAEKVTDTFSLQNVISLVGFEMSNLNRDGIIQLLSFNNKDFKKFNNDDEVYIHCFDLKKGQEFLYMCKIKQVGVLDEKVEKLKLDFVNNRRFAYLGTGLLSILKEETKVDEAVLKSIKSFVNIEVIYNIPDFKIIEKPKNDFSYWRSDQNEYVLNRNNVSDKKVAKIQIASFDSHFSEHKITLEKDWKFFRNNYNNLYEELESILRKEINNSEKFYSEKSTNLLDDFIKKIKEEVEINDYNKAFIERCIYYSKQSIEN